MPKIYTQKIKTAILSAAFGNLVGMARFELAIFWSQTRRVNQAALHPEIGAPDRIRTRDPQIRSLLLYPAELLAHFGLPEKIA